MSPALDETNRHEYPVSLNHKTFVMSQAMQVVHVMDLDTVNRGHVKFTISQNSKGFYAHEIGHKTQWARIFGKDEYQAHRINRQRRWANQHKAGWTYKPFKTCEQAIAAIREHSQLSVMYF